MMVGLWTGKREIGDEDENDMEGMSGPQICEVWLAWLGVEALVSVILPKRSELVPAVSGIVNWVVNEILLRLSFSW